MQALAGIHGGLLFLGGGAGLAIIGHHTWPLFRCDLYDLIRLSMLMLTLTDYLFSQGSKPWRSKAS